MNFKRLSVVLVYLLISPHVLASQECEAWFKKAKIQSGADCLLKCTTLSTGMDSFHCPSTCDELCKSGKKEKWLFQLSDLYPGLSPAEKAPASKYPSEMLQAYRLSWKAENLCLKEYPQSATNDASDACRHFIWAAFLSNDLGSDMAQKVLDAHEQEPTQPVEEKAMDLANNQRGVSYANSKKNFSDEEVRTEFKKLMKEGKLVVLKPSK